MSEGILEKMKYLIGIETVDDEDEDDYEEKKGFGKGLFQGLFPPCPAHQQPDKRQ